MLTIKQHKELERRRDHLEQLVADLLRELTEIKRVLKSRDGKAQKLTRNFFWTAVYPLLENTGSQGKTSRQLMQQLEKQGIAIEPGNWRLFLSRRKSDGLLRRIPRATGYNGWHITDKAREIAREEGINAAEGAFN